MHVVDEDLGAEHEREADRDEQELRGEVDHRQRHGELGCLLHADDIEGDQHDDDDDAADDVPRVRAQRLPEDREVMRDEEGRDRDRDDVDEHLRPRGDEADQLVEGVAGEAGRAAGLRVAGGSFGVGRGRGREDDPGDDEDERRQAKRVRGGEAERVVDRGADVPVGGCEERRCPEHALELDLASAPAGHRASLETREAELTAAQLRIR